MTKLDELINELCPNGVEYKMLGEVCEYEQPGKYIVNSTDYNDDFEIPVLTAGQSFILGYTDESNGIYNASKESPVIIFDDFTAAFKWVDFPFKVKSSAMKILKTNEKALLRYVFHCMGNLNFSSTEHKRLWIAIYSNFQIPVPPLAVQEEIVRILDKFTSLTAELTAELTARRKQYEYYRDALLTPPFGSTTLTDRREHFDRHADQNNNQIRLLSGAEASEGTREAKVEFFKLKDLCKSIKDGMHNLPKSSLESGDYPILSAQNIYNNQIDYNAKRFVDSDIFVQENKRTNVEEGDVLLTIVATIGRSAVVKENRKVLLQRSVCALKPNEKVLPGYLKYSLDKSEIQNYMIKNAHGSAQAGLYLNQVEEITIPLPPLSVQQRIVNVLDNFDAICSDLKIGLPAEIDARKKQYEYYRDLLLTFAERGNTILTEQNR